MTGSTSGRPEEAERPKDLIAATIAVERPTVWIALELLM
jgi:hypothetical protein